ncbi:unnamed protein product [Cochlearia groenlandica]
MEVKPKAFDSKKITTIKDDDEKKKTKIDDVMTNSTNGKSQYITTIKENLKIIEHPKSIIKSLKQDKTREDDQSLKSSISSSSLSKIKMDYYKNTIQRSENTKKMENTHKNKKVVNLKQIKEESNNTHKIAKKKVWDCESTLYDSFELNSFNRQLDSAISSSARSMSMPRISLPPPPPSSSKKQSSNKISRSLTKLIKSMFGQKQSKSNTPFKDCNGVDMDKYYVVFDKTGSLTTIPESGESTELVDSEINSLVRKTVSERFTPSRLVGITCS